MIHSILRAVLGQLLSKLCPRPPPCAGSAATLPPKRRSWPSGEPFRFKCPNLLGCWGLVSRTHVHICSQGNADVWVYLLRYPPDGASIPSPPFVYSLQGQNCTKITFAEHSQRQLGALQTLCLIISHCEIVPEMRSSVHGLFYSNERGKTELEQELGTTSEGNQDSPLY